MLFFSRINVFSLVREHFLTLYDNRTGKTNWLEVFLLSFFTLAIPAVLVLWLKQPIEPTGNDCFLTVFSIAVGFLSSTLFVLADRKTSVREANSVTRLKECFYNTAFALISALFVIFCYILMIILLRAFRDFNLENYIPHLLNTGSFIIYALIVLFFHAMLMVIRRVFFIFD